MGNEMIPTDEIIKMAKAEGFEFYGQRWDNQGHEVIYTTGDFAIARFAALVSARAAAIEREACAKVCDDLHHKWHWGEDNPESGPHDCASAIRARGDKDEQ